MGWKTVAIGAGLGAFVGGPFGAVLGAALAYDFGRRRERRAAAGAGWRQQFESARSGDDSLRRAYATLGAEPSESLEAIRRKYRELAKRNHPDAMRAEGLPEEQVARASARMARINAAWSEVRSARG